MEIWNRVLLTRCLELELLKNAAMSSQNPTVGYGGGNERKTMKVVAELRK